jgi:hypothetical protein
VSPRAGLDGCGKFHPHQDWIPGIFSLYQSKAKLKSYERAARGGQAHRFMHKTIHTVIVLQRVTAASLTLPKGPKKPQQASIRISVLLSKSRTFQI